MVSSCRRLTAASWGFGLIWRACSVGLVLFGALIVDLLCAPPASAASAGVSVGLTASIGANDFVGKSVFGGQVLQYNVIVSNPGASAAPSLTIDDWVGNFDAILVSGSVSCGSVPSCTASVVDKTVVFTLASVAAGAGDLQMDFKMAILPSTRLLVNKASWTGGGCTKVPKCYTNRLTNHGTKVPVFIIPSPPDRAYVAEGRTITFGLSVLPYAYEPGDPNIVVKTTPSVVDSYVEPRAVTYMPSLATCEGTPGCTVTVSDNVVTFTFTPASFANGNVIDVQYAFVNEVNTGTLTVSVSWSGGACQLRVCPPQQGINYSTVPALTSVTKSTSATTTTTSTTPPATKSSTSSLADTGPGNGLRSLLVAGLLLVLASLTLVTVSAGLHSRKVLLPHLRGRRASRPNATRAIGIEDQGPDCELPSST